MQAAVGRPSWPLNYTLFLLLHLSTKIKFKDQKSKRVAQRIIFDNAPETLDDQPYKVIIEFIKARWKNNNSKVPWVTISKAIEGINSLEKEGNLDIFDGYKDYLLSLNQEL